MSDRKNARRRLVAVVGTSARHMGPLLPEAIGTIEARMTIDLVHGLREQLSQEVDLTLELAAMDEARRIVADLGEDVLVVPAPVPELSARRVLTMEFLDGVAIDDLDAIAAAGHDVQPVVLALVRTWFAFGRSLDPARPPAAVRSVFDGQ